MILNRAGQSSNWSNRIAVWDVYEQVAVAAMDCDNLEVSKVRLQTFWKNVTRPLFVILHLIRTWSSTAMYWSPSGEVS